MVQKTLTNVSIVVPVYGDWDSLGPCIESLIKFIDKRHKVILLNDCGPDVELMEKNIKKAIKGQEKFEYHRNHKNLGFVQTCNRAVFEIDKTDNDVLLLNSDTVVTENFLEEMIEVQSLNDKHGIVIPRSNNATLATVPIVPVSQRDLDNIEEAYTTFQKVSKILPRYHVVPTAVGFCMLIRRELIRNFGLFDEAYSLGYHEENDFSQRVNQYGYSAILSNRSFVFHLESRSFTSEKKKMLNEKNEKILLQRYPYYKESVKRYFSQTLHPADRFADVIVEKDRKKKILINLFHFPLALNGTTKNGHSFLQYLVDTSKKNEYEIVIFTQKEMANFHKLQSYNFRIVYPETIGDEIFDISYCPGQIFHTDTLMYMNRHAYKNVISMLDIIALRCDYLLSKDFKLRTIFYDSFLLADKIITISDYSELDAETYFPELDKQIKDKIKVIHQGYEGQTFKHIPHSNEIDDITKEDYILVFGNSFKHKAIKETIQALKDYSEVNFILLGSHKDELPAHIKTLPSGNLSDQTIETLVDRSRAVLFPSQYEGFGLPIMEAAHYKKPLVYFSSKVGNEIAELSANPNCFSFTDFTKLPNVISNALATPTKKFSKVRTAYQYNHEVFQTIEDELRKQESDDVLAVRLTARHSRLLAVHDYYYADPRGPMPLKLRAIKSLERRSPTVHARLKRVYRKYKKT